MKRSEQPVAFEATGDPRLPYAARVGDERWTVRVNEFPEEPTPYSLLVEGRLVEDLLAWPAAWTRTDTPTAANVPTGGRPDDDDPHERAELEREEAHLERTRGIRPSKLVR